MDIPTIVIPPVKNIESISIPLPTADVPSYVPLVVPPSDLRSPEGTQGENTEKTKYDKIEVVGDYKAVQVRKATIIEKDGKELTRSFHRYVLHPDSNIANEPTEVQSICNVVWTQEVKDAWKAFQESNSPA